MKSFIFVLVLCTGLNASLAQAELTTLDSQALGLIFNLPGPPVKGDSLDRADYQTLLNYQAARTEADCTRANHEVEISIINFFGAPLGPLTQAEAIKWQSFVNRHDARAKLMIQVAKLRFHRVRPYRAHLDIHPCVALPKDYSYPSGHSTLAEFYARILSVAFPERASAFAARAAQIAQDRNIGGVHYPTDVRDGLLLGNQIFDAENTEDHLTSLIHANFF